MQVELLVERMGQNEYIAKLGGASYRFRRNEHGHMVAEISDVGVIAKVSDPRNGSFRPYVPPDPFAPESKPAENANMQKEEVPQTFECQICHKSFDTKHKLQGHMGGAHRGN